MEQIANTTSIDTENETIDVYLTDSEDKYLLDKLGNYLTTTTIDEKEDEIMATTKKYVSLEKLGLYDDKIKDVISAGDTAALKSAKDYADSLASNYEVAGAAATAAAGALADAKAYADGKDTAIAEAKKAGTDAAAAAGVAQTAAEAAQGEVDALETYVGTFTHDTAKTVVEYINSKTDGIATSGNLEALGARVTAVEGDVTTIKGDYLKTADKTELTGKITTAQEAADTAQEHSEGVAADLAEAVESLEGADAAQVERIAALEGTITGLSGAMHFEGVVETDPTTITAGYEQGDVVIYGNKEYVWNNGAFVEFGDASVNAEAITALTGRVSTAEGKITTAEGKITAVEGAVATKAEKTYVDEQVQALQGVDTGLDTRLKAVEASVGETGSVATAIATAKQEAIDAAATDAATKAGTAETNAKIYADGLNTSMNSRVEALEAIDHDHSNKAELDLIATGDKTKWDTAAGKAHEHSNLTVLEGITAAKVTEWDKVSNKAEQTALQSEIDRATAAEEANAAAIAAFVECSAEEINAMFA